MDGAMDAMSMEEMAMKMERRGKIAGEMVKNRSGKVGGRCRMKNA